MTLAAAPLSGGSSRLRMARDIFQSLSPVRSYNQRYFPVASLVLPSCFTTTVNENVPRSKLVLPRMATSSLT